MYSKMYHGYELINLTPHTINFITEDGEEISVDPSGQQARVSAKTVRIGQIGDIPLTKTEYGEVEGLPDANFDDKINVIYIVSQLVASRVPYRSDVMIPNESVRDAQGRIVGCKSLGHV